MYTLIGVSHPSLFPTFALVLPSETLSSSQSFLDSSPIPGDCPNLQGRSSTLFYLFSYMKPEMPFYKAAAAAALLLIIGARAQYTIDPNSVPIGTRDTWCTSQTSTCPLLCLQLPGSSSTTSSNTCDATTLTYSCICGNGLSPNASEYSQTLPYYICTEWGQQCVAGCGTDNSCQSACVQNHPCGAQNPTRVNVTSSSSALTATATSSAGIIYNGFGGSAATTTASTSSKKSGAQAAFNLGQSYSLAAILVGLFAGFALMI